MLDFIFNVLSGSFSITPLVYVLVGLFVFATFQVIRRAFL